MNACVRTAALLGAALVASGCGSAPVRDLRAEAVRPAFLEDYRRSARDSSWPPLEAKRSPGPLAGVVVELSTTVDLRRRSARLGAVYAWAERCLGRTKLAGWAELAPLPAGFLADSFGNVNDRERDAAAVAAVGGAPMRYTMILLRQRLQGPPPNPPGSGMSPPLPPVDLRLDREDVCVFIEGTQFPFAPWRSNTVVIPHAAIRAALGGDP